MKQRPWKIPDTFYTLTEEFIHQSLDDKDLDEPNIAMNDWWGSMLGEFGLFSLVNEPQLNKPWFGQMLCFYYFKCSNLVFRDALAMLIEDCRSFSS